MQAAQGRSTLAVAGAVAIPTPTPAHADPGPPTTYARRRTSYLVERLRHRLTRLVLHRGAFLQRGSSQLFQAYRIHQERTSVFYGWDMADEDTIRAFTVEKVLRLTGLTKRQLQYWDEQDFVPPSLSARAGRGRRRLYAFRDLVSLRVAADLRRNGVSLQEIRKLDRHLRELEPSSSLAEVQVWIWEGRVYFTEAETIRAGRRPEQILIGATVPMPAIVEALHTQIAELDQRRVGETERRRGTLGGKLLIAGTRIPVASVQRLHEDGADIREILAFYPDLAPEDVAAALALEAPPRRRTHAR